MIKNLITCLSGSRAYGLETETSDYDYRSVHLDLSLLRNLKLLEKKDSLKLDGDDATSWDLFHFVKMAMKGNTQAMEILFSEETDVIKVDSDFSDLFLSKRDSFLDTESIYNSIKGYAKGEAEAVLYHKGKTGSKRKTEIKEYGYSAKNFVQFLRLRFCFSYFLVHGIFPVRIKRFSEKKHKELMAIKLNPNNYDMEFIKSNIEEEKAKIVIDYESRDKSLDKKIDLNYLENVCEVFLGINN